MTHGTADRVVFNIAAHTTLRVLIASYFLAVALQLIPGTDLSVLFSSVIPAPYDAASATGLVFLCSFLIMLGMATRVAALLIALMTMFASYLWMVTLGVHDELGAFWRDVALIAALLLTYADPDPARRRRRLLVHRTIVPRRVGAIPEGSAESIRNQRRDANAQRQGQQPAASLRVAPPPAGRTQATRPLRPATPAPSDLDDHCFNIFADDALKC